MLLHYLLTCGALALVALAAPNKLPAHWKVCSRSLPRDKLSECVQVAGQEAIVDLCLHGAPDYNIEPMDPLLISKLYIGQGTGPVAVDITFKNLKIYGLHGVEVVGPTVVDMDHYKFDTAVRFKNDIRLEAEYTLNGKVLVLPIKGEGLCNHTISGSRGHARWVGEVVRRKGLEYLKIKEFTFDFEPTRFQMNFQNLFNGNKALGDNMNIFLNENWREILNEVKPAIQEGFGAAFKEITNRLASKVPYDSIFPK